jgi:aspartate kinase
LREVLAVLDRHNCQVDIVASSQVSISLAVESDSATPELVADLERYALVSCEPRQAIVSVVGENLRGRQGIASRVFGSVSAAGVNVRMISQGASEINISFVIQEEDVPAAVRQLHADLFADPKPEDSRRWLPPGARRRQPAPDRAVRVRGEEG